MIPYHIHLIKTLQGPSSSIAGPFLMCVVCVCGGGFQFSPPWKRNIGIFSVAIILLLVRTRRHQSHCSDPCGTSLLSQCFSSWVPITPWKMSVINIFSRVCLARTQTNTNAHTTVLLNFFHDLKMVISLVSLIIITCEITFWIILKPNLILMWSHKARLQQGSLTSVTARRNDFPIGFCSQTLN